MTAGILAIIGTVSFAVVKLGVAANQRARAQAIADLGSLAGASNDLETAKRVVTSNGAQVLEATESADVVDLAVSFGDGQAQARAERRYVAWNHIDYGPGATEDLETTTVPTTAAPTTTRALIFATIAPTPTTRALVYPTIPPVTTKKPIPTVPPKAAPTPGTSPRRG